MILSLVLLLLKESFRKRASLCFNLYRIIICSARNTFSVSPDSRLLVLSHIFIVLTNEVLNRIVVLSECGRVIVSIGLLFRLSPLPKADLSVAGRLLDVFVEVLVCMSWVGCLEVNVAIS